MTKHNYLLVVVLTTLFLIIGCTMLLIISNNDTKENISHKSSTEIILQDIQKHNSKKDCWVYIGGVVYDATLVIYDNPAYEENIIKVCGGDGSDFFVTSKNTEQTKKTITKLYNQLKKHHLGALAP